MMGQAQGGQQARRGLRLEQKRCRNGVVSCSEHDLLMMVFFWENDLMMACFFLENDLYT